MNDINKFLTTCSCGRKTSRTYARAHAGKCKHCAQPESVAAQNRNALLIDSGYQAYAREEGHFDIPGQY